MAHSRIKKVEGLPNLYVDEVTGFYLVRIYHAGQTRSKSLGTKTLAVAKQKIASAIKEIVTTDKRKIRNVLVKDYFEGFWKSLESEELSEATLKQNSVNWRHHIEPFWGNISDTKITNDKYIEFLIWHKKERGTKLYNALKVLRKLFKYMRKSGAPIELFEIALPKKEKDSNAQPKGTFLERIDYEAIRACAADLRETIQFDLGYIYGMRVGEIAKLKKSQVEVVGKYIEIHLRSQDTKTRKPRIIPIGEALSKNIKLFIAATESVYLFPAHTNYKRPTSTQVVTDAWRVAKAAAGFKRRIRFHDLRHSAATNMAELDLDAIKACAILGMSLKLYQNTYVKTHKLNLSSVADLLSRKETRP
jgi:integrase